MLPLVAVLALLAAAGPLAAAQPIPRSGLPEPIGLAHLRRWAGAIELSPAQRHAALRALDEYRASWQEVLARPLPEGFAERGHVVRVWSRDPAAQRVLLDARRRLVEAMATLDEAFFAALVEGLNDDQQVRLERVRDARARERLASPPVDVADFGWNVVDLAAVVEHAPRPAGEAGAAVGAILADYERAVLPRLEAVHAAATRVALDLAQTWHDAFTTPPTDEAEAAALQAGLNAAFAEIWRRHAAAIDRLDDLNDRTWRRLEAVLPIDERIDWRRRWHDAQVHAGQTPGMQRWFLHNGAVIVRRALELDDLDADAHAALEALLARTEEREAALMDRSVAAKRESGARRRDVLLGNRSEPARSLRAILDEIGSEQHAIADEASRAVAEIAGAEWSKRRQAAREARRIASGAPAPLPPPPSTPRWLDLARTAESAAPEPLDAALLGLLVEVAQADGAIDVARAAELAGRFISGKLEDLRQGALDLYDAEIRFADWSVGRMIEELEARGLYENTVFIVAADHGEEFLDHGRTTHAKSLYEEVIRTPLVVRIPGRKPRTFEGLTRNVDIAPTILDLAGVEPGWADRDGASLIDMVERGEGARSAVARMLLVTPIGARHWRAIQKGELKYIHTLTIDTSFEELFDLAGDPAESEDLSSERSERAEALARALSETRGEEPTRPRVKIDEKTREVLRSLGYLH